MDLLEQEKNKCLRVIKQYNLKYNTAELKKMNDLYNYLLIQMENAHMPHVKLQIKEDIDILMEYITPHDF